MACACVATAILKENENEQLRKQIKMLKKQVKKYQKELLQIYSSSSNTSSDEMSDVERGIRIKYGKRYSRVRQHI